MSFAKYIERKSSENSQQPIPAAPPASSDLGGWNSGKMPRFSTIKLDVGPSPKIKCMFFVSSNNSCTITFVKTVVDYSPNSLSCRGSTGREPAWMCIAEKVMARRSRKRVSETKGTQGPKHKSNLDWQIIWKCSKYCKCKSNIEIQYGTKMILQNELSITWFRDHIIWLWENSCGSARAPESSQRNTLTWAPTCRSIPFLAHLAPDGIEPSFCENSEQNQMGLEAQGLDLPLTIRWVTERPKHIADSWRWNRCSEKVESSQDRWMRMANRVLEEMLSYAIFTFAWK